MMKKLFICLGICLIVLSSSIAGFCKGTDFAISKKSNEEIIGTTFIVISCILIFASLVGAIIFAIKIFGLYLYGDA